MLWIQILHTVLELVLFYTCIQEVPYWVNVYILYTAATHIYGLYTDFTYGAWVCVVLYTGSAVLGTCLWFVVYLWFVYDCHIRCLSLCWTSFMVAVASSTESWPPVPAWIISLSTDKTTESELTGYQMPHIPVIYN